MNVYALVMFRDVFLTMSMNGRGCRSAYEKSEVESKTGRRGKAHATNKELGSLGRHMTKKGPISSTASRFIVTPISIRSYVSRDCRAWWNKMQQLYSSFILAAMLHIVDGNAIMKSRLPEAG